MKELTIFETLQAWKENRLETNGLWYDWFCKDSSLPKKSEQLLKKLQAISASTKFDSHATSVFFKNNCPLNGSLYDDFRICDLESGDVIYTIVPSSGFKANKGKAELWGKENDFKEPIIEGRWQDIKNWFLG
jgi:hypothetical protein